MDSVLDALFPSTRRDLLALLFLHPDRSFYIRELARELGSGHGAIQREVSRLVEAGILVTRSEKNRVYFQANAAGDLFEQISCLIEKTVGPTGRLREVLRPIADSIELAFIYGSIAEGRSRRSSDIDLMVVGSVTFG